MIKFKSKIIGWTFSSLLNRIYIASIIIFTIFFDFNIMLFIIFYYLFLFVTIFTTTSNSTLKDESKTRFNSIINNVGYLIYKTFIPNIEFNKTNKIYKKQRKVNWDVINVEKKTYFNNLNSNNIFYSIINFTIIYFIFPDSILTMLFYKKPSESFYKLTNFYFNHFDLTYFQIQAIFFMYFSFIIMLFTCFFYNNKENNFSFSKKELTIYSYFFFIIIIFCFMISSTSLISVYISIEFYSIIMYILIGAYNDDNSISSQRSAELAIRYLAVSFFGSVTFLVGASFSFLNFGTLTFTNYPIIYHQLYSSLIIFIQHSTKVSIAFIIIGLCIKVGIAPFHSWINGIYDSFSSKIFYFSMVYPKFAFFFVIFNMFVHIGAATSYSTEFGTFFYVIGIINLFIGTFAAARQTNIKRFIMFSSIANSGYIFISLSSDNTFGFSTLNYLFLYFFSINFFFIVYFNLFNRNYYSKNYTWNYTIFSEITNFFDKFALTITLLNFSGIPPFSMFFAKLIIIHNFVTHDQLFSAFFMLFFSIISAYYSIRPIMHIWFYNTTRSTLKIINNTDPIFKQNQKIVMFKINNDFSKVSNGHFINLLWSTNYMIIKMGICTSILSLFITYETMIHYSFYWELKDIEIFEFEQVSSLPVDIEIKNIYKLPLFFYEVFTHTGSDQFSNMCKTIIERTLINFPKFYIFEYTISSIYVLYVIQTIFFIYISGIVSIFENYSIKKNSKINKKYQNKNFRNKTKKSFFFKKTNIKIVFNNNSKKESNNFIAFSYYIIINHFNFINPCTLFKILFTKDDKIIYIKAPQKYEELFIKKPFTKKQSFFFKI